MQKFLKLCSHSSLNYVWLLKHPELEKSRLPDNMLSNQCTSLQWPHCTSSKEQKWHKLNESWRQMLQVSPNMFLCAEFVSNMETWSTQHEQRTGSSFVTDYAFLWQAVDRCSNSMFEPLLSLESFHFLSELQLKKSLCRSLLLVIHHHHLLASFYSHSKDTFCHLWLVSYKGEKVRRGWNKPGWNTFSFFSLPI